MMEAVCERCGSVFRGAALEKLDLDEWERREGALCERRWCLCQSDRKGRDVRRGSAVIDHADLGAGAALVRVWHEDRSRMMGVPIYRGTKTQWSALHGGSFVRHGAKAGHGRGGNPGIIPPDELARLEAWWSDPAVRKERP